jgi:hypothetical protein
MSSCYNERTYATVLLRSNIDLNAIVGYIKLKHYNLVMIDMD